MFVLAVGLLGVAALIPAGRSEIAQGSRLETAAMVGRSAFRDLQVRGYLDPTTWVRLGGLSAWDPWDPSGGAYHPPFTFNGTHYTNAAIIDPLGSFAQGPTPIFRPGPPGVNPDNIHLTRTLPNGNFSREFSDVVFRAAQDIVNEENETNADLPPVPRWFPDTGGSSLRRASVGNYSWLATVVIDPLVPVIQNQPISLQATVSVVVFHKRNLSATGAGESRVDINEFYTDGLGGGEANLTITGEVLRPGDWLLVMARRPAPAPVLEADYFRWYRINSAIRFTGTTQVVTLAGQDWNAAATTTEEFAYHFDNVVAVYEKNIRLDIP